MYSVVNWVNGVTKVSQGNMNQMDQGTFDAYYQSGALPFDDAIATLNYTGDLLTSVTETISGDTFRLTTLNYTGDLLTSVNLKVYVDNVLEFECLDTLNYTGLILNNVERTVL